MKYFSYAWSIIENIITLFIAWLLYSIANTSYEIIVVSLLLVIYAHIVSSSSGIAIEVVLSEIRSTKKFIHILQVLKRSDSVYKEYKEIRKGLGDEDDFNYFDNNPLETLYCEDEVTKEQMKEQDDTFNKLTIQAYISGTFTFFIYALAVWKIITTLF